MKTKTFLIKFIFLASVFFAFDCSGVSKHSTGVQIDYEQIKVSGNLRVTTHTNLTDHFVFRGSPFGFQMDLLGAFTEHLSIDIQYQPTIESNDPVSELLAGKTDLIASAQLYPEDAAFDSVILIPVVRVKQVLIARKNREDDDFTHKNIFVQQGSSFIPKLNRLGKYVNVMQIPDYNPREWTQELKEGMIDYLVCDENNAKVLMMENPDFEMIEGIEWDKDYKVWMVRKTSPNLATLARGWLENFKKTSEYAGLYDRYFNERNLLARVRSDYFAMRTGRISPYDDLIKKYSRQIDWDWKLVAALMYNESGFDPAAVSKAGAYGLMQLMPATLEKFGLDTTATAEQQIMAGVFYLKELDQFFTESVPDKEERIKFVFAAYNSGPAHILDAQRIASSIGKNPEIWDGNVDMSLLIKSNPTETFDKGVVRYGVCRGDETFRFVRNLMLCFDSYDHAISD
ncbi:MAG: transporter substrate-binding domain-containing protein [Bacteroidales bacterium]|nr:transporter substrate-binding domain-containing protein [Bacteroidales bacterium]